MSRSYDAILLDLDGTLLDDSSTLRPRSVDALREASERGVAVMVVTGRSKIATLGVLEDLGLSTPAVLFNGAAVYCPERAVLLEERTLSNRTLERALAFGEERDDLTLVMGAERKLALQPRTDIEARALHGLHGLEFVTREELRAEYTIRVTYVANRHESSDHFAREVEEYLEHPVYLSHFPLSMLPLHRGSPFTAVDVHAPCWGKAEALRVIEEHFGIQRERVVAVGDATNDIPMIRRAGLGVAMANSMKEVFAYADRTIGSNESDAIAELVGELFLS